MEQISIAEAMRGWGHEDLQNLWVLLGGGGESPSLPGIEERIKWLYCSQIRASTESAARNVTGSLAAMFTNKEAPDPVTPGQLRAAPRYDEILIRACKTVKAYEPDASLRELELFLSQAVIAAALHEMRPRERLAFFESQVTVSDAAMGDLAEAGGGGARRLIGPATTFAALGAAQASGFGVYAASTTALGFLTHAVGVTLPFAVYTGMTSTIAFLIGPAGFLAASLWAAWALTQPSANKLIGPVVYIAARNSRPSAQ